MNEDVWETEGRQGFEKDNAYGPDSYALTHHQERLGIDYALKVGNQFKSDAEREAIRLREEAERMRLEALQQANDAARAGRYAAEAGARAGVDALTGAVIAASEIKFKLPDNLTLTSSDNEMSDTAAFIEATMKVLCPTMPPSPPPFALPRLAIAVAAVRMPRLRKVTIATIALPRS